MGSATCSNCILCVPDCCNKIPGSSLYVLHLIVCAIQISYIIDVTGPSLTHWGRVTHIHVSKLTIIGSDYGLSPGWSQAITWTNAGILLIQTLGTNFNEILNKIHTFSFTKMSSGKWRPFCLGLNVLMLLQFVCLINTYVPTPNGHL